MPRAALYTLLVVCVLAGSTQAQRAGGTFPGSAAGLGLRSGFIGPRGSLPRGGAFANRGLFPNSGFFPRSTPFPRHFHSPHSNNFDSLLVPYFLPFDYEEPYTEAVATEPAPAVIILQPAQQSRPPESPPARPQLIEVTGGASSQPRKVTPPTLFILTNGERLETERFVLTSSDLSVMINRQQHRIPVTMLDINATVSANRERGIELRIPADPSEISLGF